MMDKIILMLFLVCLIDFSFDLLLFAVSGIEFDPLQNIIGSAVYSVFVVASAFLIYGVLNWIL